MFLQNLLKKISEITSSIERELHNNYIEVLKKILIFGAIFIFFLILLVVIVVRASSPKVVKKQEKVVLNRHKEDLANMKLFLSDEFEYPNLKLFDLTNDYISFLPMKKYSLPSFKQSVKDYDVILKDSIEDGLKFKFEK